MRIKILRIKTTICGGKWKLETIEKNFGGTKK